MTPEEKEEIKRHIEVLIEWTRTDIKAFSEVMATKEDLKQFPTRLQLKLDLTRFATKEDLERFATKDDLKEFPTKKDLGSSFSASSPS